MDKFYTNVIASGNNILVREVVGNERITRKVHYNPTFYVDKKQGNSKFTTLNGAGVEPISFDSIKESKEWISNYENMEDFHIYGNTFHQYTWIGENYREEAVDYDPTKMSMWSIDIEVEAENGFPQVEDAAERINLITFKNIHTKDVFSFGLPYHGPTHQKFACDNKKVVYRAFNDEVDLCEAFLDKWAEVQPDVVVGWNVEMFDVPYLIRRMHNLMDEDVVRKALSPWGMIRESKVNYYGQDKLSYVITGVSILDYLRLYRKYNFDPRENFKLHYISTTELGIGKIEHDEYATFSEFYKQDWQKYVDYNIRDVELVESLDAKLKLIDLVLMVAYRAKVNYEDVLSQTRVWDMLIYNYALNKNKVIPFKVKNHKDRPYEGAYVKEPVPGMYRWVVAYDVQSLYPNIMRILNIGFETKAIEQPFLGLSYADMLDKSEKFLEAFPEATEKQHTLAANGVMYDKTQKSIFSDLLEKLFNLRLEYKSQQKEAKKAGNDNLAKKFDVSQQAVKVILNSCYGAVGSEYFRYYDLDNAEAVTITGQFIIKYIERGIGDYLNNVLKTKKKVDFVIAVDTDSNYITFDLLVKSIFPDGNTDDKIVDFLNKTCEGPISALLVKLFDEICIEYINGMNPKLLKMVREVIADKGIWTAKKRYILNVLDDDGEKFGLNIPKPGCDACKEKGICKKHSEPKLKYKGIEVAKASNPKFCRDRMRDAITLIMNVGDNEKLLDYIDETRNIFEKMPPEEISSPKGCNGLNEYGDKKTIYKFKTPMHTKGALLYNHLLEKKELNKKYQQIQEGEKISYVYLKLPNPIREKVISFSGTLPKEFGLHKYIDYNTQFEKTFLDPLNIILKAIKWNVERRPSLEKWF